MPLIKSKQVVLYVNVGDHKVVWERLCECIPELLSNSNKYFNDWDETCDFADKALDTDITGIHDFIMRIYLKLIFYLMYIFLITGYTIIVVN